MTQTLVSVIVVSRGRPDALRLCLTGVSQLYYPAFEIIVVADRAGIEVVNAMGWQHRVKAIPFEEANIAAARNAGAARAAGDVLAFIDDDAVPAPTWLDHLIGPFANPDVVMAGGYVLGRNGISFQWKAGSVGPDGRRLELDLEGILPMLMLGSPQKAIKTEGTNMAIRRDVLVRLGGFDPAYRFYLDDTDLNMRIARDGGITAIVPLARVHHGYAASDRRTDERAPRDLTEIAASMAVFRRKFSGSEGLKRGFDAEYAEQRRRVLAHMVAGRIIPEDVTRLLRGFVAGWETGLRRAYGEKNAIVIVDSAWRLWVQSPPQQGHTVIKGRIFQRRRCRAAAREAVQAGHTVSLYLLSFSSLYHTIRFMPGGYWEQSGGQFGRSDRADKKVMFWKGRARFAREIIRVAKLRENEAKTTKSWL